MNDETETQGALGQQHVGRFSEGIEQLPDTPNKRRIGRFSAGIERRPQAKLRKGRFSEGMEQLPRSPSRLRRGSFANGYDKVRQPLSAVPPGRQAAIEAKPPRIAP